MDNWEKIKQEIKLETKEYFKGKTVDIDELVGVLQKVLRARIPAEYRLDGVAVNIPKAMYDILDEDTTRKQLISNFAILCKFEQFLRKVLFFLNPEKYQRVFKKKKAWAQLSAYWDWILIILIVMITVNKHSVPIGIMITIFSGCTICAIWKAMKWNCGAEGN